MKIFLWSQESSKYWFVGYPVKFFKLAVSSLEIFFWFLLKPLFSEINVLKRLMSRLARWKKFKISTTLSSIHNVIIIIINLFHQVFNVLVCSTQRKIFVITRVFEIMQFDMLQIFFNCSYRGSTSLLTRIIERTTHRAFICSKSTIETLKSEVNNKDTRKTSSSYVIRVSLLLT